MPGPNATISSSTLSLPMSFWIFLALLSARFQVAGSFSLTWITIFDLSAARAAAGSASAPISKAPPSRAPSVFMRFMCRSPAEDGLRCEHAPRFHMT